MNQNVTMKFLYCPTQTGPYFGINFTLLKDHYSFRMQNEKERHIDFSVSVFFLKFVGEALTHKHCCDHIDFVNASIGVDNETKAYSPRTHTEIEDELEFDAVFWEKRKLLIYSFNKFAFKERPFADWAQSERKSQRK